MEILFLLIGAGLGGAGAFFLMKQENAFNPEQIKKQVAEAEAEAKKIHEENKTRIENIKHALAAEEKSMEGSFEKMETVIRQKEEILNRKEERNKTNETAVKSLETTLRELTQKEEKLLQSTINELGKRSGLTQEKALKDGMPKPELRTVDGSLYFVTYSMDKNGNILRANDTKINSDTTTSEQIKPSFAVSSSTPFFLSKRKFRFL